MNILIINHYAGSIRHGMEFRPYYMAREWLRLGHNVKIVSSSFSHIRANNPNFSGRVFNEIVDGVDYRWYKTPAYAGNGIGRVLNIIGFLLSIWLDSKRLANEFRPDIVIASSTYPMDIWPALKISKFYNSKVIYEVHDLWPLSLIELGGMSKWHPFVMWVQAAENFAYRHADKVVSMLPEAKQHMVSHGMIPDKFCYVPNGVDVDDWSSPTSLSKHLTDHLDSLKKNNRPIVAYAGTFGLANALDILLDAAVHLSGIAQILLVGTGPERKHLENRIKNENINNVSILPSIPKTAIPTLLERIDIAYIGLLPHPLFRFGISPNKLMDYMMAGKPIILSISAGNDPVADAGCGVTVPPGDANAVVNAVITLSALSTHERTNLGLAGRKFILAHQTYNVLANRFICLVNK